MPTYTIKTIPNGNSCTCACGQRIDFKRISLLIHGAGDTPYGLCDRGTVTLHIYESDNTGNDVTLTCDITPISTITTRQAAGGTFTLDLYSGNDKVGTVNYHFVQTTTGFITLTADLTVIYLGFVYKAEGAEGGNQTPAGLDCFGVITN